MSIRTRLMVGGHLPPWMGLRRQHRAEGTTEQHRSFSSAFSWIKTLTVAICSSGFINWSLQKKRFLLLFDLHKLDKTHLYFSQTDAGGNEIHVSFRRSLFLPQSFPASRHHSLSSKTSSFLISTIFLSLILLCTNGASSKCTVSIPGASLHPATRPQAH